MDCKHMDWMIDGKCENARDWVSNEFVLIVVLLYSMQLFDSTGAYFGLEFFGVCVC